MTVVKLVQPTEPEIADEVLQRAKDAGMIACVIVGYDRDGNYFYDATMNDAPTAIFHLQRGIHRLNRTMDELEEAAD